MSFILELNNPSWARGSDFTEITTTFYDRAKFQSEFFKKFGV
jgi:hypothetical protein